MKYSIIIFLLCLIVSTEARSDDAAQLIKELIKEGSQNYIESCDFYQFEQYEKVTMSARELPEKMQNKKVFEKLGFLFNYLDTTGVANGKNYIFAMREILSDGYRRKQNKSKKSIIKADLHYGFDDKIQGDRIDALWSEAIKQVNIFDHEINFLFKRFISPLSPRGHNFYDYSIIGTIDNEGTSCLRLTFVPKNNRDLIFEGELWVEKTNNGSLFIRKVILNILGEANINFIPKLKVVQDFDLLSNGKLAKSKEITEVHISVFKVYYQAIILDERIFDNYKETSEATVSFASNDEVIFLPDSKNQPDSVWVKYRQHPPYFSDDNEMGANDKLGNPVVNDFLSELIQILISNYAHTGHSALKSKFDIGPVWSIFSHNEIEGFRIRLGGTTTAKLNRNLFLKGYVAYGTKDEKMKYSVTTTYSFLDRLFSDNEFPKNNLTFNYQYDTHIPGQTYYYGDPDNFFFSFKRGRQDQMTYKREGNLFYEKEFGNGLYWKIYNNFWNEKATGSLYFLKKDALGNTVNVEKYYASEVGVTLRYARNEKFNQGRDSRFILRRDGPVFTFSQSLGLKNYLRGDYNYYLAEISGQKRFWLSGYGHIDLILKGGRIWGDVPFPLLILPNANQTYALLPESYSLMNTLEFINDKYASLDFSYRMDGWLFNRIPGIQNLKLREVLSFKALFGGLSSNNYPENNNNLFLFPENSYTMRNKPYMEVGFGIENIFKFLRVDYVRRLSYLNHDNISKNGLRVALVISL